MKRKLRFAGALFVLLSGAAALLPTTAASAVTTPKLSPTITVTEPGGSNGPYVTGTGFTPDGKYVVYEWVKGATHPPYYTKLKGTADASGDFATYDSCDGNTELKIQALDKTTKTMSNVWPAMSYLCIG